MRRWRGIVLTLLLVAGVAGAGWFAYVRLAFDVRGMRKDAKVFTVH